MRFISRLGLQGLLSFSTDMEPVELQPLNVLIGPNGSGKTNFIESLEILRALPTDLSAAVQTLGGVDQWAWKGSEKENPIKITADMELDNPFYAAGNLRYEIELSTWFGLVVSQELLQDTSADVEAAASLLLARPQPSHADPHALAVATRDRKKPGKRILQTLDGKSLPINQSVLSKLRDFAHYPELTRLAEDFSDIVTFREWHFGTGNKLRRAGSTDDPSRRLLPDCRNLALVLNEIQDRDHQMFNEAMKRFLPRYERVHVKIDGGAAQLFFREAGLSGPIAATQISDGTLRFLAILALLLSPSPPPLLCLEEPELGMHPDAVAFLSELLVHASSRMQIIVTTHSDVLLSALTGQVDSVVVCENIGNRTVLNRLETEQLAHWLGEYRLGDLWRMGELGGNP